MGSPYVNRSASRTELTGARSSLPQRSRPPRSSNRRRRKPLKHRENATAVSVFHVTVRMGLGLLFTFTRTDVDPRCSWRNGVTGLCRARPGRWVAGQKMIRAVPVEIREDLRRFRSFRRRDRGGISTLRLSAQLVRASGGDARIAHLARPREVQHCVRREQANGESLVEEESLDEYVVEQRKCSCWTREKHRFGGGKQATS